MNLLRLKSALKFYSLFIYTKMSNLKHPETFIRNEKGTFTCLLNGKEQEVDEKYVMSYLKERRVINLPNGTKLELINYDEGEICTNPNDSTKTIFCDPLALALFEFIVGGIIAQNDYGVNPQKGTIPAIKYFQKKYPKEYKILFTGVIQ